MPRRSNLLPPVLLQSDLPLEELRAALLDGELYAIDEGFGLIDGVETAQMRGASLASIIPPRLIAELGTAAWIHGAQHVVPAIHELCAETTSRYRTLTLPRAVLREVSILPEEIDVVGSLRVTTPLRTALDLVRLRDVFGEADAAVLTTLADRGGFGVSDVEQALLARRRLPGKLRALSRLRAISPR